jgi:hypothetical protein
MDQAIEEQQAAAAAAAAAQSQAQAQAPAPAAAPATAPAPAPAPRRTAAGGSRAKKRKEEEKKPPARDWSALTTAVKKWPEVTSAPVENWLKNKGTEITQRIVGHDVYRGENWSLAQTQLTMEDCLGGVAVVRISGAFLGSQWKVRGEPGWDDASANEVRLPDERKIWGTDVYTDDSDLGLVLIHAGWIRWGGASTHDDDAINVTVRVVPTLVHYTATARNGVTTRGWGNSHDGASIVVEGVERIRVDKASMARLPQFKRRKMAMAERALEAAAMNTYAPAPLDLEAAAGVLGEDRLETPEPRSYPASWNRELKLNRGLFVAEFTPEALVAYLDPPGDDDGTPNLWTHNLYFGNGKER